MCVYVVGFGLGFFLGGCIIRIFNITSAWHFLAHLSFKVSLSLFLICCLFFLILDPFYLSVNKNTTLTTPSCKAEAKVNLSSVCQRWCTKGKTPRGKRTCQSLLFSCVDSIDKTMRVYTWSGGCFFRWSYRNSSFSFASNAMLWRICKACSHLAHSHVFLHTF